jgi:hypothetical protein
MKQAETRLLDLYSNKFHSQNDFEYKLSKEVRSFISSPQNPKSFYLLVL